MYVYKIGVTISRICMYYIHRIELVCILVYTHNIEDICLKIIYIYIPYRICMYAELYVQKQNISIFHCIIYLHASGAPTTIKLPSLLNATLSPKLSGDKFFAAISYVR